MGVLGGQRILGPISSQAGGESIPSSGGGGGGGCTRCVLVMCLWSGRAGVRMCSERDE